MLKSNIVLALTETELNVTREDLRDLLTKTFRGPANNLIRTHPQYDVLNDLNNLKIDDSKCSIESISCKFIYFARALPHLWGRWMDENRLFSVFIKSPIISTIPYVWIHVHLHLDGKIAMVQSTLGATALKVETCIFRSTKTPLEKSKWAYDGTDFIPSSKGQFLQLVIKMDEGTAHIPSSGGYGDFMVVLTSGKYYILQGVYYSGKKKVFELLSVCHDEQPQD